jgi:hypothetical protein
VKNALTERFCYLKISAFLVLKLNQTKKIERNKEKMLKSSLIFKNQKVLTGVDNRLIALLSYETSTSLTNSDDEEHQSEEKKRRF